MAYFYPGIGRMVPTVGINIKNPETESLIRELAELTGKGQTEAVTQAVRNELESLRQRKGHGRYKRMMEIAEEMAPLFEPPYDRIDHADLLYDKETGLPK